MGSMERLKLYTEYEDKKSDETTTIAFGDKQFELTGDVAFSVISLIQINLMWQEIKEKLEPGSELEVLVSLLAGAGNKVAERMLSSADADFAEEFKRLQQSLIPT